jgi:hypothetical protein
MTISKERLNTLIVEKARERCSHYDSNAVAGACIFEFRLYDLLDFAHALLKQVEAESEVVTKQDTQQFDCFHVNFEDAKKLKALPVGTKLIALPLIGD